MRVLDTGAGFCGAFRQSNSVKADIEHSQKCDQQPDYRSQHSDAPLQLQDLRLKLCGIPVQDLGRDDGAVFAAQPA